MRALGVRSFGKVDKFEIFEVPIPSIVNADDILVKVKAIGLNQGDLLRATGYSRIIETVKLPMLIGNDYAGIVSAVGESVTDFSPGDAVYGLILQPSASAEYVLLTSNIKHSINKLPGNFSFEESAAIPVSAHTALSSLLRIDKEIPGGLKGKTVLVPAGLGGIGSIALQLLKPAFGAGKVITTLSTAKIPRLSALLGEGLVDQIVDYTKENVIKEIGRETIDVLLDTTFQSMAFLPLMKPGTGIIMTVMWKSGDTLVKDFPKAPWVLLKLMNAADALWKWRASRWGVRYEHCFTQPSKENLDAIDLWVKKGWLKALIGGVAEWDDLEEVRRMLSIVGSGKGAVGKYVIKIS